MGGTIATQRKTDARNERSIESASDLVGGPYRIEVRAHYSDRIIFQQQLVRAGQEERPFLVALFLMATLCLLVALGALVWRLGEVHATYHHREQMQRWARTHAEAKPYVPELESRPLLEATFVALLGAGLAAGFVAAAERRRLKKQQRVSLGESPRCDVVVSCLHLPADGFPVLQAQPTGFCLQYTESMTGQIELAGGRTIPLRGGMQGRARPHPRWAQTWTIDLPSLCRCWLEVGALTLVIEDSAGPDSPVRG